MTSRNNRIAIFHNLPEGGGLRMIDNVINRYKNKFEIDLYVISDMKPKKIVGVINNYIHVRPWKGFIQRNLWIFFVLPKIHKKLAKRINKTYKKILVTHDYFTKSPYLLRYLKINNIYLCQETQREFYEPWEIHAPSLREKIANIFRLPIKTIDRVNTMSAGTIICNSKYSQMTIKSAYNRASHIVYPGVDEHFFKPHNSKKEKIILCVGGLNPVKNQLFLVSSLKPILNEYKLVLVGKGKKEYMEKIINQGCNSSNIKIVKNISDTELRSLYRKAMVTCISAHKEPFGLSSLESQSCGTPVVSVKEGGPIETIINGKTGYLVQKDSGEYLDTVLLAITNSVKMGKSARKNIVGQWTWKKTLKKLDKYLK